MLSSLAHKYHLHTIIVASGIGSRMKSDIPKQFLLLDEKPILLHTINQFRRCDPSINITIVLSEHHISLFKTLCKTHQLDSTTLQLAIGGSTRFHSVKNGLAKLKIDRKVKNCNHLVAVHDAVRPLVSRETIAKAFLLAAEKGTAVASIPVNSSLRQYKSQDTHHTVDRSKFKIIQTPQVFTFDILSSAYQTDYRETFTDDATVVEALGQKIYLFDDSPYNIKITTPDDLKIATALLKLQNK